MPVHRAGWRESRPPGVPFGVNWSSPQANGLLGWWPLHGDRGSNVAVDRVYGRTHAITPPSSGAMWVEDPEMGAVLRFDNAATEIVLSNVPKPTLPVTMCFWVQPSATDETGLYDTGPNAADTFRQFGNGEIEWHNNDPQIASIWPVANVWYHMALGYWHDGSNRQLSYWRDGVLVTTAAGPTSTAFAWTTPRIGTINTGGAGRFSGYLADFRFYDRLLSDADVAHLYNPATRWDLYRPLMRASVGQGPGSIARVSQVGLEVLLDPTAEATARVSQVGLEVLLRQTRGMLSQLVAEVAVQPVPAARLSQLVAEVAVQLVPAARLSQLVAEVAVQPVPAARLSQLAIEVAIGPAVQPTGPSVSPSDETARGLVDKVSWPR